jgi:hypothetical protein
MSNGGKIELETKELLELRQNFKKLVNVLVDEETPVEHERVKSKKELDAVRNTEMLSLFWTNTIYSG